MVRYSGPTAADYGSLIDDIEMQTPLRSPSPPRSPSDKKNKQEIAMLRAKMDKLCSKDPTLRSLADELHSLTATPAQLRNVHNLFLEPLKQMNKELKSAHKLDKFLSLSIMVLGTLMPMCHMFHVPTHVSVGLASLIPILQGINMNMQPHQKVSQLEKVKAACITEGHHFLSLTGDYCESDHHDEEEIKHFLEAIESHRHIKPKPKKKDKEKKGDKDKGKK